MLIRVNSSDGPVASLVDALVSNEANKPQEPTLRAIASVYDTVVEAVQEARESDLLTELGKREAIKRAIASATSALESHDQAVERIAGQIASTRRKALERPAGERSTERLMLEREIRDRIAAEGADPAMVQARYLRAINAGDTAFASAVENAPQAFRLLDDETRQRGEEARIARSPHAEELERLTGQHDTLRRVVAAAKSHIRELAETAVEGIENVA